MFLLTEWADISVTWMCIGPTEPQPHPLTLKNTIVWFSLFKTNFTAPAPDPQQYLRTWDMTPKTMQVYTWAPFWEVRTG